MSNWDCGRGLEGIARLAYVGMAAITALTIIVPIGLVILGWWVFHHVSIH